MILVLVGASPLVVWALVQKRISTMVSCLGKWLEAAFCASAGFGNIFFFRLPISLALFKLLFMSSPKSCCVTVYSKSHDDAQVRSRKGLIF